LHAPTAASTRKHAAEKLARTQSGTCITEGDLSPPGARKPSRQEVGWLLQQGERADSCYVRQVRQTTPPPDFAPPKPAIGTSAKPQNTGPLESSAKNSQDQTLPQIPTVASEDGSERTSTPKPPSREPSASVAPTTTSNVRQVVADSKFHDETLCQLLDAARLNLIGIEAKRALNRAARARVVELRDLRAQGMVCKF